MDNVCDKMPALIKLEDFNNDFNEHLEYIYKLYLSDFQENDTYYKGKKVKTFTELGYNLKQKTFNHITTENNQQDRLYNLLRMERYHWIKKIIEGDSCQRCDELAVFKDRKGNKENILIWCRQTDFLVVLEKRKNDYYLITAYVIQYSNKRKELESKYTKFICKNQNRPSR